MSATAFCLNACLGWMEQIAGDLMAVNASDLPALARIATDLQRHAREWESPACSHLPPEAPAALRRASERIVNVVMKKEKDLPAAMAAAGDSIETARAALRRLASAASPAPAAPLSPLNWVDDSIVAAYAEQLQSVFPEMEQLALAFERVRDPNAIPALRRLVHTLKGESGAVGAMDAERVCHRLEDYLAGPQDSIGGDVLLSALDWISRSANAFAKGMPSENPQAILDLFSAPSKSPQPPPPAPPPGAPADAPDQSLKPIRIGDPDLAADFLNEAQEHFEIADENLIILEKSPGNADSIGAVFRSFHTIKGVAGFLGISPIGDLAHAAETILDEVRKGKRSFVAENVEAVFGALDLLKLMVADLRSALQADGILQIRPALPPLLAKLRALVAAPPSHLPHPAGPAPASVPSAPPPAPAAPSTPSTPSAEEPESVDPSAAARAGHPASQTMKVDSARIDQLLDMIGELVIIESIVAGDPEIRALRSLRIEKNLALLGKITRSLRDMGMSMRMVPVDPVFKKMARLVRDLSRKSGKDVELVVKGGDTEIDKGMVEKLGDPLVHMIRNSMDHGIESGADRAAAGKPSRGRIELRAHHVGGSIHIDIEDDGRGLDREAILRRGVERGLVHNPDAMSDQDVYALIFQPGFSTARQITEISGRGVGMDVVKRNIESLRGNVLIRTEPGKGSTITLVLPLTTAIIDGMLVRVGRETNIVPTLSILESFRPGAGQVHLVAGRGEMVSFRGNLLPLFRLSRLLDVPDAETDPLRSIVMVVEEYGKQWGLMVDELLGQQQIVIKSLGDGLGRTSGVVGASILADGRPGLILDLADIIRIAQGE